MLMIIMRATVARMFILAMLSGICIGSVVTFLIMDFRVAKIFDKDTTEWGKLISDQQKIIQEQRQMINSLKSKGGMYDDK